METNTCYISISILDIDECRSNNGGCRVDKHAFCVNYPGGHYCGCHKGYILKDDSKTECVGKFDLSFS